MARVNYNAVFAKILKSKQAQAQAHAIMEERVDQAKEELLSEFNEHQVTQEIELGPTVKSDILPSSYGNLFSFLGFSVGRQPTEPVRKKLESISVNKKPVVGQRYWFFKVRIPSEEELESVSFMDWESGRSWLSAVSKGLSGFSHYLFTLSRWVGRSGTGIQVKPKLRGGTEYFKGTPYVFEMLTRFKNRIGKAKA